MTRSTMLHVRVDDEIKAQASEALASMGTRAEVAADIDTLVRQVVAAARPGDQILCMSNGGFGGIHAKLLAALAH